MQELWRLVDTIYQRGMQDYQLFLQPGNPLEVRRRQGVRACARGGGHSVSARVRARVHAHWR